MVVRRRVHRSGALLVVGLVVNAVLGRPLVAMWRRLGRYSSRMCSSQGHGDIRR